MPSFIFTKSSKRDSQQVDRDSSPDHDNSTEKVHRRQSKRDFFRRLLKRSSIGQEPNSASKLQAADIKPETLSKTPEIPRSPLSDPNKPLPPQPSPGTTQENHTAKRTLKIERIISSVSLSDLHKLFSGAPQFFARSTRNGVAPHASVAFPWDSESDVRDLTDHINIQDSAWACMTAGPYTTIKTSRTAIDARQDHEKLAPAQFMPLCRERPDMLSMLGIEKGTMGFQATLEIGIADASKSPSEEPSPDDISNHRKSFLQKKAGLRPLTDLALIDLLINVSGVYNDESLKYSRPTIQLYSELFTQILYPPFRVTDSEDPYSFQVQIEALVEVLSAPIIWVDFSRVDRRIQLGQFLWGVSSGQLPDDENTLKNESMHEPSTQKYWLLLQILLSCELLIRLDMVAMNADRTIDEARLSEMQRFEKNATTSVKWSLLLARRWLENIRIEKPEDIIVEEKPSGWLSTLKGNPNTKIWVRFNIDGIRFEGRHQARQLSGLVHFARNLQWPNLEAIEAKIASNGINILNSVVSTPAGTPRSVSTKRSSSYFSKRPAMKRIISTSSKLSAIISPAGWLSNSYISGLVLPGEALSHFLISTLLENDDAALSRLGDEANLYGGFVYSERSFWSTSCVVGRVLAAKQGASECIGWISSDVVPRGIREGWVDIDVETTEEFDQKTSKPQIWHKTKVERNGHVIGVADSESVLLGDFVLPTDDFTQQPLSVTFESLDLFAAADTGRTTPTCDTPTPLSDASIVPIIKQYSAMMRFLITVDGEHQREINMSLAHNVSFLSAHLCAPSQHIAVLRSPISPPLNAEDTNSSVSTGHYLHKGYTFTKLALFEIISNPDSSTVSTLVSSPRSSSLFSSHQFSTRTPSKAIPKVLVIDCIGRTIEGQNSTSDTNLSGRMKHEQESGSDLEMLGRALCAERNWNAIISRRGRSCLACAIREAGSVGWRVILRVA